MADRYPGTSGRTHGERNETIPAKSATGTAVQLTTGSTVESGELFVDEPLELRVERTRVFARRAASAPRAEQHADDNGARDERNERKEPGKETEAPLRRRREHPGPELGDESVLDLLLGVAGRDPYA